jgi:predicted Zn-dependent protease
MNLPAAFLPILVRRLTGLPVAILALLLAGCTSSQATMDRWLDRNGGLAKDGVRLTRAERALAALPAAMVGRPLTVAVLDSDQLGAFGWQTGRIFVTRALVDLVDDAELTAAIAHEIGHLSSDNGALPLAALGGGESASADEIRADAAARELVARAGLREDSVARLLEKLARDERLPITCRRDIVRRLERLGSPTGAWAR